jgi:hypothetical protein
MDAAQHTSSVTFKQFVPELPCSLNDGGFQQRHDTVRSTGKILKTKTLQSVYWLRCRLDGTGFESREGKNLFLVQNVQTTCGIHQSPIQ